MVKRLRVSHIMVQPVVVWDDGEELTAGPQLNALTMPLSQLAGFAESLPGQLAELAAKLGTDKDINAEW